MYTIVTFYGFHSFDSYYDAIAYATWFSEHTDAIASVVRDGEEIVAYYHGRILNRNIGGTLC